ncbi:MAG TPA: hypothetical protein VGQ36_01990 [Thermoanaerobaculia bacterium]|jgi:hypothetical protein|nr:hypothetical protein [Thermoanaerobaculia bacterium]
MNEETRLVPAQVTSALTSQETKTLVPVAVAELTTKMVAALDLITALIPDLRKPHPATKKQVRGARTVPRDAIVAIVAMVESARVLQSPQLVDIERAHEVLQFDDGFRVLDQRIEMLRAQVSYTVEARWAELVTDAMAAYHMAKRYAKDPRYPELAHHVATIRELLDRKNGTTGKTKSP